MQRLSTAYNAPSRIPRITQLASALVNNDERIGATVVEGLTPTDSVFMLPREVATLLRTPEPTLRSWRREGYGPSWAKLRGRVMYPRAAVQEFQDTLLAEAEGRGARA